MVSTNEKLPRIKFRKECLLVMRALKNLTSSVFRSFGNTKQLILIISKSAEIIETD